MSLPPSLQRDRPDQVALHSPVWRESNDVPVRTPREHVPLFYSRAGAGLSLEGLYRGGHAFLMAGGPSVQALDLAPLQRRWVMTMNNGPKTFRGQANCTVDDPSRFSLSMWLDPNIMKFMPMAHFEKPLWDNRYLRTEKGWEQRWETSKLRVGDCPNVVGFRRNEKFHASRWLNEETINWGNHSKFGGGRSVMLASLRILYSLGFRFVYLLGVDFEMSATKRYHFDEQRSSGAIKGNMDTYAKLQQWFAELQPHFEKARFVVRNCNPNSKLTAFPHLPYDDAIAEAGIRLGDPSIERTEGMYSKPGTKGTAASQPAEDNAEA
jgi:hypothetical protein